MMAEDGSAIVPLLGGHHGANALARQIADALEVTPAITTAGDIRFGVALDAPPEGWTLANPEHAKEVMAALLSGAHARLTGSAPWLEAAKLPFSKDGEIMSFKRPLHQLDQFIGVAIAFAPHPERKASGMINKSRS